ncbi:MULTISPECIES: SDR family oxidoreductase [unclassified Roseitalea]|uniref:SDR family NAD(P)-dependent oxidoreductase n=1 Tax=unclassified Roseitalea TaxID=2639107 RepID=UPI00273E5D21|nr:MULTISPECIES: SDR family oxidoreductase [unclassified Roseitalea]
MELGIKGKMALVTGGASGTGQATARLFVDEGAEVIIVDRDGDSVSRAQQGLGKAAHGLQADLCVADQVNGLAQTVRERFRMPDIVVCAAGVTGARGHPLELRDADWREAWENDFMSVVRTARVFLPSMAQRGWGRCVVVTSENAMQPYWEEAVYNVAKAALLNFSKGLSRVYAKDNVLVNAVSPAFIETPMTESMMESKAQDDNVSREEAIDTFLEHDRPHLELKRRGRPEEVAATIAFLCSERASFVVGANYRVDGGSVATIAI